MTKFEELLKQHHEALGRYSRAMDSRSRAMAAWAEAKVAGAPDLGEKKQRLEAADRHFQDVGRELSRLDQEISKEKHRTTLAARGIAPPPAQGEANHGQ